ncbi:Sister chromatid cohesion 1 protein 4 [Nymphaea thermarum]|nr:Sister chromatid cohesion 1 protein 4 [Nymphaea thermarum]
MFYSHFILARKGPLGTVWMAAHLQNKLRKSQVTETNISASIDSIMFPEVPIALRLSGHLLLGVVRIYSRKVDYLHHDCNEILTKLRYAFASIEIDLPEDASTAPIHTVTIPETLELDAIHLDQEMYGVNEFQDIHIRTQEDITIPDKVCGEEELYATFNINEESSFDRIEETVVPDFGSSYMDIDSHPYFPSDGNVAADDPTTTVNIDKHGERHHQDDIVREDIEVEIMRDAANVSGSTQVVSEFQDHDKTNEEPQVFGDQVAEDHNLSFISEETPTRLASSSPNSHQSPKDFVLPEASKEQENNSFGVCS